MYTQAKFVVVVFSYLAAALQQQPLMAPETQYSLDNLGANHQEISTLSGFRQLRYGRPSPATGFVAFGDSYSAGIGTGVEGDENNCRQGRHAYPQLMAADRRPTTFQFLSCTGATTSNVMAGGDGSQLDLFDVSVPVDFGLLSIGGNDLGFFEVINACVFRFYNFYSGTCEDALAHSRVLLESDEFEIRLRIVVMEILDKIRWEKKP
ncbi:hypothetical protein ANO14919_119110 [Xylariales sp. No.14919]|nr:hypothetical protein ANO14919_119110 [Xylariales sp. No.14919]